MQFIDLKKQYQALKKEIDAGIHEVLDNSNYILGKPVGLLEEELANFVGVKHCVTCANGTDALTLALKVLNVGEGDVVFVPTFTFFASAETVSAAGAKCAFVNVDPKTFNICPNHLEETIKLVMEKGFGKPKAVIPVDLFGLCANYPEIEKIAKKYNLLVLEDGAQGFGGSIDGKFACGFGDIATTSFFPAKPLGCYGDGGAVFTNNDEYAKMLLSLRFHGKGDDKYDNVRIGLNSRLDTIQAAVLRVKLKAFTEFELQRRQEIGKIYDQALQGIATVPFLPESYKSSYAQYTLTLKDKETRDRVQAKLKEQGVPSMVYYPKCMHQQTAYSTYNLNNEQLKASEELCDKVLSLPMHPYLEKEEMKQIINAIRSAI